MNDDVLHSAASSATPPALDATFTLQEARSAGMNASRLRRRDMERLGRGVYRWRPAKVITWEDVGRSEPHHRMDGAHLATLLRLRPDAVLSHETAAHIHGIPFPPGRPRGASDVDLTLPPGTARVRSPGLRDHRRPLPDRHTTTVLGLRITSVERTWLDLCSLSSRWEETDLVAAGDHLIGHPWTPAGRVPPRSSVERIRAAMDPLGRFWGSARARAALERMRVGADSPAETRLRLALIDAGLGEPELQAKIRPEDPWCPEEDMLYTDCRLALQYEGPRHRTPEQFASDARRDQYLAERDHMTLHVSVEDMRTGFGRVFEAVRRRRRAVG